MTLRPLASTARLALPPDPDQETRWVNISYLIFHCKLVWLYFSNTATRPGILTIVNLTAVTDSRDKIKKEKSKSKEPEAKSKEAKLKDAENTEDPEKESASVKPEALASKEKPVETIKTKQEKKEISKSRSPEMFALITTGFQDIFGTECFHAVSSHKITKCVSFSIISSNVWNH